MNQLAVVKKKIPEHLYRKIYERMPIVCVDLIVVAKEKPRAFLMLKRERNPEKGHYWFPGGRLLKNESLVGAARRLLKQETGLRGKVKNCLGFSEFLETPSYFKRTDMHNIAFPFLIEIKHKKKIHLDQQSVGWQWFTEADTRWHPYLKKFLKQAGFKVTVRGNG